MELCFRAKIIWTCFLFVSRFHLQYFRLNLLDHLFGFWYTMFVWSRGASNFVLPLTPITAGHPFPHTSPEPMFSELFEAPHFPILPLSPCSQNSLRPPISPYFPWAHVLRTLLGPPFHHTSPEPMFSELYSKLKRCLKKEKIFFNLIFPRLNPWELWCMFVKPPSIATYRVLDKIHPGISLLEDPRT